MLSDTLPNVGRATNTPDTINDHAGLLNKYIWGSPLAANMGGSTSIVRGSDPTLALALASKTFPEPFPAQQLTDYATAMGFQSPAAQSTSAPVAGAIYDCATGKCSDGRTPNSDVYLNNPAIRFLACTMGIDLYKRSICSTPDEQIEQGKIIGDNATAPITDPVKALSDYLQPKKIALGLLAIILISLGVYSALK